MADSLALDSSIFALLTKLAKEVSKSQHSNHTFAARENGRKAEVVLETSRQKFQVWRETWTENEPGPAISPEKLWGIEGWADIQKLLGTVQDTAHRIESELAKRDGDSTLLKWKRAFSLTRKNQTIILRSPSLLDLTVQLSRSIDELWTYSEGAFDSLHGFFAHQMGPPLRERLLSRSLDARTGSLALYRACSQSNADYSLEVDLFSENSETQSVFRRRSSVSSMMPRKLYYHLFAQDRRDLLKINEITIESVSKPGEQDLTNAGIVKFDIRKSDLAAFESWPPLKSGIISIQPQAAYEPSYFRIVRPPVAANLDGGTESLAQLLYKERIGSVDKLEQPLSQETKVGLAFKVVECGFYLLGTPWLASLSSKRLRRMKTQARTSFVLEIQTLDLEDLYFEDPNALSEQLQLFSIGVVLVEIALSDERNPANIKDPELRKSKILPLVERSMGSLYAGATAFCLQDRRSAPHFERPEKYKYPEETGWTSYLTELLEDYHAQVFSR